ncbi:MAG: hypothetical protein M1813_000118 [Trichoglossum hirsutum]|nr:MAG: hypothetical protein M1813_000118 [Trichoglossum hirsutum]
MDGLNYPQLAFSRVEGYEASDPWAEEHINGKLPQPDGPSLERSLRLPTPILDPRLEDEMVDNSDYFDINPVQRFATARTVGSSWPPGVKTGQARPNPETTEQPGDTLIPSSKELEEHRVVSERNAVVEDWLWGSEELQKGEYGSIDEDDSDGDDYPSELLGDESSSMFCDSPAASAHEVNVAIPDNPEEPLPHQTYRAQPRRDTPPLKTTGPSDPRRQPLNSNAAIALHNRVAGNYDEMSMVATFGTRRLSETDIDQIGRPTTLLTRLFSRNDKSEAGGSDRRVSFLGANPVKLPPRRSRDSLEREVDGKEQPFKKVKWIESVGSGATIFPPTEVLGPNINSGGAASIFNHTYDTTDRFRPVMEQESALNQIQTYPEQSIRPISTPSEVSRSIPQIPYDWNSDHMASLPNLIASEGASNPNPNNSDTPKGSSAPLADLMSAPVLPLATTGDEETYQHQLYAQKGQIPFRHIEPLGQGSYGYVDKVERTSEPSLGQTYARKVIRVPVDTPYRESTLASIQKEVDIIKNLRHLHIVRIAGTYICGRAFAIIMTPVAEENLEEYLHRVDDIALDATGLDLRRRIKGWFGCMGGAIDYVHRQHVRHRDVKPSNFLTVGDTIILTDFGIASDFPVDTLSTTTDTPGARSPMYCAPEVAQGHRRGRLADMFSLGAVFLEMLTVYSGPNQLARLSQLRLSDGSRSYANNLDKALLWIDSLADDFSHISWFPTMLFLCRNMLQKERDQRPTAEDVRLCWSYQPFSATPPVSCECSPAPGDFEQRTAEGLDGALRKASENGHKLAACLLIERVASIDGNRERAI